MRFFWVFKCCHLALWRQHDVVVRPCDGTGKLAEDDGLFWDRGVLFNTVVTVVHTNTHNFLWGQQRRQQLYVWPFHHTLTRIQGSVEAEKGIIPYTDWKKDTNVFYLSKSNHGITLKVYAVGRECCAFTTLNVNSESSLNIWDLMQLMCSTFWLLVVLGVLI